MRRSQWLSIAALIASCTACIFVAVVEARSSSSSLPEASSTLLRMHRLYLRQPPHDTALYDLLHVSPNATAAEISKSYRRLSKRLHPDKQQHRRNDEDSIADAKLQFEVVRQAYEVLKDDRTRLPYHRHGLLDVKDAVFVLTGKGNTKSDDPLLQELLRLMGYEDDDGGDDYFSVSRRMQLSPHEAHKRRVWYLASNLIELVRPVVEGALSDDSYLLDQVIQQCDRLKGLPLGAQIVRCIGRAYRYSGRRVLRRHHYLQQREQQQQQKSLVLMQPPLRLLNFQDSIRDSLRHAKYMATAAVAGGRVVLEEHVVKMKSKQQLPSPPEISSPWNDHFGEIHGDDTVHCVIDSADNNPPSDEEIKEAERHKADVALLESLQVEALWKICKIDLDRTIREACDLILDGGYFFFPSHLSDFSDGERALQSDGWVGSSGVAVTADLGRIRTASLLVRMGDVMVQRSKEGTAWME